jgi:branched-chain amino acid transport system permease protein
VEFIVMAVVLVLRPWGLLGRAQAAVRGPGAPESPLNPPTGRAVTALLILAAGLAAIPAFTTGYTLVLLTDVLVFALFAASLHFMMGPGGMASFGHAAYFGLGAYGAGLLVLRFALPMELALALAPLFALAGALVFGWFCVRLSGVYLAMLTLAFAQIAWSVAFQWDTVTGGSNGMIGVWPAPWLASKTAFYYAALLACAAALALLWRMIFSPFGYALRASRDSSLRAEAIGIPVRAVQWAAFCVAGLFAGLAGALFAFSKGSISPETLSVPRSVDALVMVLLGGLQTVTGPMWGAALFVWLEDTISRGFEYWRAAIGAAILLLVLAFPQGIAGFVRERLER